MCLADEDEDAVVRGGVGSRFEVVVMVDGPTAAVDESVESAAAGSGRPPSAAVS